MKHYNIYQHGFEGMGGFQDERGLIVDIFHKLPVNSCALITNTPGAIRANHYHKKTIQYTYILEGTLTYYWKPVEGDEPAESYPAAEGDFITSDPNEIHAWKAGPDGCKVLALAAGVRGGTDYEDDTFRVDSIVPKDD